jgi:NAD(P)-dependent dehydrogenase (short-subunit alcohol dehydrogenase family)
MSRIFISGSSTGLGLMAGELLASQGHQIVLHARNADREADARHALPKVEAVATGDVETIAGAKDVAAQVTNKQVGALGGDLCSAHQGHADGSQVFLARINSETANMPSNPATLSSRNG